MVHCRRLPTRIEVFASFTSILDYLIFDLDTLILSEVKQICILWLKNTFSADCHYTEKELKTEPVLDKILKYKTSWIKYVDRMQREDFQTIKKLQATWIK
jgi:hypothetical protein